MINLVLCLSLLSLVAAYQPTNCTVTQYTLAFLRDDQQFKIHGLWPDQCQECLTCTYPTCCRTDLPYTRPSDDFLTLYWFNSTADGYCQFSQKVELFEHEYYTHASCLNLTSSQTYLNLVKQLYTTYQSIVAHHCQQDRQLFLKLTDSLALQAITCG